MKLKILPVLFMMAIAASGCFKDSNQQPIETTSAIITIKNNISGGTWTGVTSVIGYFDVAGVKTDTALQAVVNLKFDGLGGITETTIGAHPVTLNGTYTIAADASNTPYITTGGAVGNHNYAVPAISSSTLTLYEIIPYPNSATTTINHKPVTYYKTIQITTYKKTSA